MKKKIMAALIAFTCILAGCSSNSASQAPEPMTQAIVTDDILSKENEESSSIEQADLSMQSSETTSAEAVPSVADPSVNTPVSPQPSTAAPEQTTAQAAASTQFSASESVISDYYRIKAELDALDIDKENLEATYRVGKIEEAAFRSQKELLDQAEEQLDAQKDLAKSEHHSHNEHMSFDGSKEDLIVRLYAAEQKEDEIEAASEQLEEDYRAGSISREDFISQQANLLSQDDLIDQEKDGLEHSLKQLGWDD